MAIQKILIVDDKKDNLILLEKILQDGIENIEIIKATNGQDALNEATNHYFALAIMDVQMPEMDGYEVAENMRRRGRNIQTPIIFLSAVFTEDEDISKGYESGGVDFVTKPYNPSILANKVKIFLELDLHKNQLRELARERALELAVSTEQLNIEIDQHHKAEDKLRKVAQEWQETFDAIDDMVAVIDLNHRIIRANRAMIEAFDEPVIGECCCKFIHGVDFQDCPARKAIDEGGPAVMEIINNENDHCYNLSLLPVIGEDGKIHEYIHIARDVTNQKKLQEQMRQGEKMQALGLIAGGIAHDFNNQLTPILGFSQILKNKLNEDEELCNYSDMIVNAAKRSSELVKQLLSFSRKSEATLASINLHELIVNLAKLLDRSIPKNITVIQELNADCSVVKGDYVQIQNAFLNMAINASHAMPNGGTLTFTTKIVELTEDNIFKFDFKVNPGKFLQVSIADNGSGMDNETCNRVFEPFFTTKEEGKGTGMGMAMVYSSIKNCEGAIDIYSELGQGTIFKIYLPLDERTLLETKEDEAIIDEEAKILVIDDEDMVRAIALKVLDNLGYPATACASGKEGIELYRKSPENISLVLLDIVMPEIRAEETLKLLQDINPKVKVIITSGFNVDERVKKLIAAGAHAFVQKPFIIEELSDAITSALEK